MIATSDPITDKARSEARTGLGLNYGIQAGDLKSEEYLYIFS